ncbi:MAG: acyl-CoA dehydrogenase [Pseudomonadota bacterium]
MPAPALRQIAPRPPTTAHALAAALPALAALPVAAQLRQLAGMGLAHLPQPGAGSTLLRWQALCQVAQHSLALAKLYEGHTDALAILQELGHGREPGDRPRAGTWGMWAAEAPGQRVQVLPPGDGGQQARLSGAKAWCSGAQGVSHALLTAWLPGQDQSQLVAVELGHPSIRMNTGAWQAVGMADTLSAEVAFDGTPATLVGVPGDYLRRPGFWHGGAGIAACWYGGTLAVADALYRGMRSASPEHPAFAYRAAAFGKVDRVLAGVAALLREGAGWIDAHPQAHAMAVALRVRQAAEAGARCVLDETGRALGATPYCRDAAFARAAADLPVFIRQSHGDRDDAALAGAVLAHEDYPWTL